MLLLSINGSSLIPTSSFLLLYPTFIKIQKVKILMRKPGCPTQTHKQCSCGDSGGNYFNVCTGCSKFIRIIDKAISQLCNSYVVNVSYHVNVK